MAYEWVAPVAAGAAGALGAFFTWLTGVQGRTHAERLSQAARQEADRREAYLALLRFAQVDMRRVKYRRDGKTQKLAELEEKWPKGERVAMSIEAEIAADAFCDDKTRRLVDKWSSEVVGSDRDLELMETIYEQLAAAARDDLNASENAHELRENRRRLPG